MSRVAGVVIGRNEGARLRRCLETLAPQVGRIVYVDSGSTDGSVALAREFGCRVVELDMTRPFTAARGRNAGFDALREDGLPDLVQFVDGDCAVVAGWIAAGQAELEARPALGMVTGCRSEVARGASVYNALCDVEWRRPAGEIAACGGDMLIRSAAWEGVGGMNEAVIAAEDDELCVRLRKAGWTLWRLPVEMTRHDAAMTRFGQWWRRAVRTGHGFAQVGFLHPDYFRRERLRAWIWGLALPLLALFALLTAPWGVAVILLLYVISWARTARGLVTREGLSGREAVHHAVFLTLSKIPNAIGMLRFHARRLTGRAMRIIEYK